MLLWFLSASDRPSRLLNERNKSPILKGFVEIVSGFSHSSDLCTFSLKRKRESSQSRLRAFAAFLSAETLRMGGLLAIPSEGIGHE